MPNDTEPRRAAPRRSAVLREDHAGHLDPDYAASLRARGREGRAEDDERAYVSGTQTRDTLAEELAEDAVSSMTGGENGLATARDAAVDEDAGGPFVPTTLAAEAGSRRPRSGRSEVRSARRRTRGAERSRRRRALGAGAAQAVARRAP